MNRLLALALALSAFAISCGGTGSEPTGGGGTTTTYAFPILPANENPPVTNGDRGIDGKVTIKITAVKDGNTVKSATAEFEISGNGFPAGTTITGGHIHSGGSAVNSGIYFNPSITSSDMPIVNGTGSVKKSGLTIPADVAQAILGNPSAYYFNLHTALNTDGAARGQLATGGSSTDPGAGGGVVYPY